MCQYYYKSFKLFLLQKIKTLAVDFKDANIYEAIEEQINELGVIGVLVNNVGTVYPTLEYFTQVPQSFNESYFNVNMLSMLRMLQIVLPRMEKQKTGIVINVTSQSGAHPTPLMATYSASNDYKLNNS